ncbi:ABC transporter permease [Corynebacterium sp. HMSC034A01]|uniref:ABC transporter permease n=1 Tax=Corynebacterium sp. HMSC034A01 TaxID=1739295 RepID=UPI0008A83147|nr:ABC transporter permease [Corynebacterium sp. HMSC034A01]OHR20150.1 hypothetical protein HMPREF2791_02115 [Corynebacterium sp. HMSC034A01]
MHLITNDLLKFKRSHMWAVVVLVPLIAVGIGASNYSANSETLSTGWDSYFSQIMLFYGLLFCTAGIAVLAAYAWRVEHRGHNWLTMLTSTRGTSSLVASKIAAISIAAATMHAVLVILALAVGLVLGVPGEIPVHLLAAAFLSLAPIVAVAAWQSLLSMVIRSFAAPIGIAVVASLISFGALASGMPGVRFVSAPALLSETLWLGSTAVADAGAIDAGTVLTVVLASAALAAAGWAASVAYLRGTDARL